MTKLTLEDFRDSWTCEHARADLTLEERREEFDSMVQELKADVWDEGYADGCRQENEGDDGPRFVNPYREED